MGIVSLIGMVLIALTTAVHYEVLRLTNRLLTQLNMPGRLKVVVVIFAALAAHAIEIAMYGFTLYLLVSLGTVGTLTGPAGFALDTCLYFSAETYTSLGFGDLTPMGPIRMLAGIEALNGLLLIGWSASFLYIVMERFWNDAAH